MHRPRTTNPQVPADVTLSLYSGAIHGSSGVPHGTSVPPQGDDADEDFILTTDDLAAALRIAPQTLRKRLCLTGSYFGEVPRKGRNGRWWWSRHAPVRLRTGRRP